MKASCFLSLLVHISEVASLVTFPLLSRPVRSRAAIPAVSKRDRGSLISSSIEYNDPHYGFFVNISVGTPPQDISLLLTTAAHTWLAVNPSGTSGCEASASGANSTQCRNTRESGAFVPSKSSTYVLENGRFDLEYPDKSYLSGTYSHDILHLSSASVSSVPIITSSNFSAFPSLGLGLSTDASRDSFPQAMLRQGLINSMIYTISYDGDTNGASLLFDAVDNNLYEGDLLTYPFDNYASILPLTKISMGTPSSSITLLENATPVQAELQIGTSSLWLPRAILKSLTTFLGSRYDARLGIEIVDCSRRTGFSNSQLNFTFTSNEGTSNVALPMSALIAPLYDGSGKLVSTSNGKPTCFLLARDSSLLSHEKVVLGTPFLRAAYVVTDLTRKQLSVAPAVVIHSTSKDIVAIPSGVGLDSFHPRNPNSSAPSRSKKGYIIGGIIGSIVVLAVIVGSFLGFAKRRKQSKYVDDGTGSDAPEVLDDDALKNIYRQKVEQSYHLSGMHVKEGVEGHIAVRIAEADSNSLHEMLHDASVVRGLPNEELYIDPMRPNGAT